MPKTTAAEVEQRVNQIYMLLLQGEPREKICQYASQNWGITSRQTDRYITSARQRMTQALDVDRETLRGQAIAQRNDLYRLAYKERKYFTSLQILDSRDRILGLFDDINTHIQIVEAAGYEVRNPATETEDGDPAGELFAAVERGTEDGAEAAPPDAANSMATEATEDVQPID